MQIKILVTSMFLALSTACSNEASEVKYDHRALGFADEAEMRAAFEKGYHTKAKLLEMMPPPVVEAPKTNEAPVTTTPSALPTAQVQAPTAPIAPSLKDAPTIATAVATEANTQSAVTQQPDSSPQPVADTPKFGLSVDDQHKARNCDTAQACVEAMLAAAKAENLTYVMEAARRIDSLPKPSRGDRKAARKLNDDGLAAFREGRNLEALNLLSKAHDADRGDEEIVSNLVYVYSEDGNYTKALSIASQGFLLNPRRANLWLPYAQAAAKQGNPKLGWQALWLAWQFSANRERMLTFIDKLISEESNADMKYFYETGKSWLTENKSPQF